MLAAAVVFIAVLLIFLVAYLVVVVRPEAAAQAHLRGRLRPTPAPMPKAARIVKDATESADRPLDRAFRRVMGTARPLELLIERASLRLSVPTFVFTSLGAGLLVAALVARISGSALVALVFGLMALPLPYFWVRSKVARRMKKFEEQFPEGVELIARALRAGHAFSTGLALAAEELPDPVGAEFRYVYERQNFGMSMPDALRLFAERVPLVDARFFTTAVLTQRETGGNLAEILDNLASVVRQRFKVQRQVRVVTAHARLTGWVLVAMPIAIVLGMLLVAPEHVMLLVNDPLGVQMLLTAVTLWALGFVIIRRLVNVEY